MHSASKPAVTSIVSANYNSKDTQYYIGLMSGTSTDGVDGVLAAFTQNNFSFKVVSSVSLPMPTALRTEILALNQPSDNELDRSHRTAQKLVDLYAKAVKQLLQKTNLTTDAIRAIGVHGQTVRHRPDLGYTVQLNAPALLAELTQIDVIADFRSRDIAAGGQGAPLVPAFHQAIFQANHLTNTNQNWVLLNLGGIANISVLTPNKPVIGFDTGPGNMLMDYWCQLHTGAKYDQNGAWGSQGAINPDLLCYLIESEPWLSLPAPKSTGRDLFNKDWLNQRLTDFANLQQLSSVSDINPMDVQATLRALTVQTVLTAIKTYAPSSQELIVFGGGALNQALMNDLAHALTPHTSVRLSDTLGIPSQFMEALAFAWLAHAFWQTDKVCTPNMTGARHATIAGCFYPR